jgi:hypothetical protein
MTPQVTPFDHRPDPALGAALRFALAGDDEPAFVARVLARVGRPLQYWEVLASWSRAGITAAAAAALFATFLVGRTAAGSTPDPDLLASATTRSARVMAAAPRPPDPGVVLAGVDDR